MASLDPGGGITAIGASLPTNAIGTPSLALPSNPNTLLFPDVTGSDTRKLVVGQPSPELPLCPFLGPLDTCQPEPSSQFIHARSTGLPDAAQSAIQGA
jgi:hypothetical protein